MRILIADDEPLLAESLGQLLGLLGHEVSVAWDSTSTLDRLYRQPPDLLLLDWIMPEGGGRRVLHALSAGEVPGTHVVLMTGSAGDQLPAALDGHPILFKPFRLRDLRALLASLPLGSPQSS